MRVEKVCAILLPMNDTLLFRDETYAIRGAVFEVYKNMGNGFPEEVYQQCMERELLERGIPYDAKKELTVFYKGSPIKKTYIPDLWCYGKIIVELKAVKKLNDEHRAQLFNYLLMTKSPIGLLVNFGNYPKVDIERYAL